MESSQIISAINQSVQPAEKKLKPLEIINIEKAEKTLTGKLISQAAEEELKDKLKLIYVMVGLRPHHFPDGDEKNFLHGYIYQKYGNKTLNELVLAFDLAIQGQLDIEDTKVYDQFTCEYLARIMNGYRDWLKTVSANAAVHKKNQPVLDAPKILTDEEKDEWIEEWKQKEKINIELIPPLFYEHLDKTGKLSVSKKEKWEYLEKAKQSVKAFLLESMDNNKPNDAYKAWNSFQNMENDGFTGEMKERIINRSKKLIVYDYLIANK